MAGKVGLLWSVSKNRWQSYSTTRYWRVFSSAFNQGAHADSLVTVPVMSGAGAALETLLKGGA